MEDSPVSNKEETHKRTKSETKEIYRGGVSSKTDKKFDTNENNDLNAKNSEVFPDRRRMESFSNGSPKSLKEESPKKIIYKREVVTKLINTEAENISSIIIQAENDDKTPTADSPHTPQRPRRKKSAFTDSKEDQNR